MSAPAAGTAVTFVIDHLSPDAARRLMALFDRPHGAANGCGDLIAVCNALKVLPRGEEYGQVIGLWTCLDDTSRAEWRRQGLELMAAEHAPAPAVSRPAVYRGRGVRRGRVVNARRAFGRGRRSR